MRASSGRRHISGAETIVREQEIPSIALLFIQRALTHPKGRPEEVVLTVEKITQKIKNVPVLPVKTLECGSTGEAKKTIKEILLKVGISEIAIKEAFKVLYSTSTMRGASLIDSLTGERLEPDRSRGIRVSRLGISRGEEKRLSALLSSHGINTLRVKEALILASKVASCPGIIAEVCVSDDPDYTTGYVASKRLGYLRITSIKKRGSRAGGRVFFVKAKNPIEGIIRYLEKRPVMVTVLRATQGSNTLTGDSRFKV